MRGIISFMAKGVLAGGIAAAAALGLAGAAAASGATPLTMGTPVAGSSLVAGQRVGVTSANAIPSGGQVRLFGINAGGDVVAQSAACTENSSTSFSCTVPSVTGGASVADWVALDPAGAGGEGPDGNDQMGLSLSPKGSQPGGTSITATVSSVAPNGASVFLVGVEGTSNPDATSGTIKVLSICNTDGTTATCTFTAPNDYNTAVYSFEAHTLSDVESVPVNNLPEVPYAAAIPLMMIPAGLLLRYRMRHAS